MDESHPLVEVRNLKTHFPVRGGVFRRTMDHVRAVDGVDLVIRRGETVGLVGESGCGKSTLGRTILRLVEPTAGSVIFDGQDLGALSAGELKMMRSEMQLVFQDPGGSLDPRMTVFQTVAEGLAVHGVRDREEQRERVDAILEDVGMDPGARDRYPHEFSGGQRQRIGIARALVLNPTFLVADEPVSALDVSIQSQVLNVFVALRDRFELTCLFIAHDLAVVDYVADRIAVMYLGRIVEVATAEELRENPLHPYTEALLSAIPEPDPNVTRERLVLEGDVPSPLSPPSGCSFRTRCPIAQPICAEEEPPLEEKAPGHHTACHFSDQMPVRGSRGRVNAPVKAH